ncbi:MAG: FGGY-family carbohydrate kinase [Gammaproteobacteria bacterium]|nr:FGGY-family carbohydrate kinase [Gammaproteobacteria bacterium]
MKEILISIDLGTTRLKVAAFSPRGTLHHQLAKRHRDRHAQQPGREETYVWQDADEWWHDAASLVAELVRELRPDKVIGISLSGRGGAGVFTDANGIVVAHPWSDMRHRVELQRLYGWRTGNYLPNYGAALLAKYHWLENHEPVRAKKVAYAFYAKDFLLFRLTGVHKTDWSSGPDRDHWDAALFAELGVPRDLLPAPALPWELAGGLAAGAATVMGIDSGVPVAVGAHDGICANAGAGATRPGEYAVTLGTHAVVRAVMDVPPSDGYRFYSLPENRHIMGGNALLGGRSADWFLDLIDSGERSREELFVQMDRAAAKVSPGAAGIHFLPFLAGQLAPHLRPGARAMFSGIGVNHGRAEMYRAVLEGTGFAIKNIFDQVRGWCGEPSRVRLTGGGAQSNVWTNLLAAILDHPLECSDEAVEGRGAAIFLAVALGIHPSYDTAADVMVPVTRTIDPTPDDVETYRAVFENWSRLNGLSREFDGDS